MLTDNLISNAMLGMQTPNPKPGMGATICLATDRHAATIVRVTRTQVHVQRDHAGRADSDGPCDTQAYTYTPNPKAPVQVFRLHKDGRYYRGTRVLLIGTREEFYDYTV